MKIGKIVLLTFILFPVWELGIGNWELQRESFYKYEMLPIIIASNNSQQENESLPEEDLPPSA